MGARLLPQVPEPPPGLPRRVVERRQLGRRAEAVRQGGRRLRIGGAGRSPQAPPVCLLPTPDDGLRAAEGLEIARPDLILRDEDTNRPATVRYEAAHVSDRDEPARLRAERERADVHPRAQQREPLQVDEVSGERPRGGDVEVEI